MTEEATAVAGTQIEPKHERILRWPGVYRRTGISRSSWLRGIREGIYPKPIKLAPSPSRAVGWLESDIDTLIERLATTVEQA